MRTNLPAVPRLTRAKSSADLERSFIGPVELERVKTEERLEAERDLQYRRLFHHEEEARKTKSSPWLSGLRRLVRSASYSRLRKLFRSESHELRWPRDQSDEIPLISEEMLALKRQHEMGYHSPDFWDVESLRRRRFSGALPVAGSPSMASSLTVTTPPTIPVSPPLNGNILTLPESSHEEAPRKSRLRSRIPTRKQPAASPSNVAKLDDADSTTPAMESAEEITSMTYPSIHTSTGGIDTGRSISSSELQQGPTNARSIEETKELQSITRPDEQGSESSVQPTKRFFGNN